MPLADLPIRCGCGRYYWPHAGDTGQCEVCNVTDGPVDPEERETDG